MHKPWTALPLVVGLLLFSALAQAAPKVEIFQLHNREASDLLQHLEPLYPDNTVVFSADGQRLMVKAEPQQLEEIRQLVTRLDVAPVQLRISVRQVSGGQKEPPGTQVITTQSHTVRSIVVQSGEAAHIKAGSIRRVPTAVQGGRNPAMLTEEQSLESGILVQPKSLGRQQVELKVVTFENEPAGTTNQETAALVSILRITPGEWVSLGGSEEENASTASGGRVYDTGSQQDRHWEVKVDVVN
ncbi:secretin N-terminal domain-containing protein [Marinobacteraceae bacterium S3BR75-40.1]